MASHYSPRHLPARITPAVGLPAKSPVAGVPPISPAMLHRIVDLRPARHVVVGLDDGLDGARLLVVAIGGLTLAMGAFMAGVL